VRALGRLRVESARPLLDRLAETPSELRPAAVEALGSLGGRESLPTIMTAYASNDVALIPRASSCDRTAATSAHVTCLAIVADCEAAKRLAARTRRGSTRPPTDLS